MKAQDKPTASQRQAQGKPRPSPEQAQTMPRTSSEQAQTKPRTRPGQAQNKPRASPEQTQDKPRAGPGQVQSKPRSSPGQAHKKSLVMGPTSEYLKPYQIWGHHPFPLQSFLVCKGTSRGCRKLDVPMKIIVLEGRVLLHCGHNVDCRSGYLQYLSLEPCNGSLRQGAGGHTVEYTS